MAGDCLATPRSTDTQSWVRWPPPPRLTLGLCRGRDGRIASQGSGPRRPRHPIRARGELERDAPVAAAARSRLTGSRRPRGAPTIYRESSTILRANPAVSEKFDKSDESGQVRPVGQVGTSGRSVWRGARRDGHGVAWASAGAGFARRRSNSSRPLRPWTRRSEASPARDAPHPHPPPRAPRSRPPSAAAALAAWSRCPPPADARAGSRRARARPYATGAALTSACNWSLPGTGRRGDQSSAG